MSFLLNCPDCGRREVAEFSFGGESNKRPAPDGSLKDLARYLFFKKNIAGLEIEWWYHRDGCQQWFLARRDTRDNVVQETFWPEERASRAR